MDILSSDPCLGPEGYITDEMQVGMKMFARYYLSHHSQDLHYKKGTIASLNKDIQMADGDIDLLASTVKKTLERYYLDAFKEVYVEVKLRYLNDDNSKVTLSIALNFGTTTRNDLRYGIKTPFSEHAIIRYSQTGEYTEGL